MSVRSTQSWLKISALVLVFSILIGSLPFLSPSAVAQASKTINLEIIVDSSGSMAAVTDTGVFRIDAAKQVLNQVIDQIPDAEGVNVGFRVYGHRGNNQPAGQAESCVSSDLMVPMQGVDKAALTAQVNALQPVGWTPLGYALQQAANDFTQPASENVVNAIIMVTDGLETCGADPAAIAGELKNSPAGITTHVIGFGTTPDELAILQGITQASGGQLLGSNNAGQLMSSLFTILEELEVVEETGTGEARNSPLGIGRIGRVGDYEVSVISVTPNATDIVMAENEFNEPPAEGTQFFMARVATTYVGSATGTPWLDLSFQSVGNKSTSYELFLNTCGVYPDDGFTIGELFQGGSAEFNVCWEIDSADQDSLVMYVEPSFSFESDPVWFSLDENYVATAPTSDAAPTQAASSSEAQGAIGSIGGEASSAPVAISLSAIDIAYDQPEIAIPANTDVALTITNDGVLQHNFVIDDQGIDSGLLNSGESTTITLNLPPGTYSFHCDVPGHTEAGQTGTLIAE